MDVDIKMKLEFTQIIERVYNNTLGQEFFPEVCPGMFIKDRAVSIRYRSNGNELFLKKEHTAKIHYKIWENYTKSIAFALKDSEELAAGYANRSAYLRHARKFNECLIDIDRVLRITTSNALKIKLLCRKTECFVVLQEGKQRGSLQKAKYWLNKIDDSDKSKKNLIEMIKKTEKFVEKNISECSEPKIDCKIISCSNNAVTIDYKSKYERCLVATKNIKLGESVYVEKFYAATVNDRKTNPYCSHCLAISWAVIPCDHCSHFLYCSEKCKDEAWIKYHDIECSLRMFSNSYLSYYVQLSTKSFIMGLKETGNIKNLKKMVEEVDNCEDRKMKGFSENGKFISDSFRSLCSLKPYDNGDLEYYAQAAIYILFALIEKTDIFGKELYKSGRCNYLSDDTLFVSGLLLRLILICRINAFDVLSSNYGCKKKTKRSFYNCLFERCCPRGMHLSLLTSLINHDCNSNTTKFYTNDGFVVYVALKPINKHTQIFSAYNCNWTNLKKPERQKLLNHLYAFNCDCLPCKKNWPVVFDKEYVSEKHLKPTKDNFLGAMMMEKYKSMMSTRSYKSSDFKTEQFVEFIKDLEYLVKYAGEDSIALQTFIACFQDMIQEMYSMKLYEPAACKTNLCN